MAFVRPQSSLLSASTPASPSVPEAEKPSGVVMTVSRCLNRELDGDYAELMHTHNGKPIFRKTAGLGNSIYLYYAIPDQKSALTDSKAGWTIDKVVRMLASSSDGAGSMAYLGPSACGADPSKPSYGEYWKVWYASILGGGYYSRDNQMKVVRKPMSSGSLPRF